MGLQLNIGSGQRPFGSPWINLDKVAHPGMPKPDVLCDGAEMPFPDNSASVIVLSHVAEHLQCGEGAALIKKCYEVLHPNGSLLVFVPDLRALAARWLIGEMDTQLYLTSVYGAYMGSPEDTHKWGFDYQHLWMFLSECASWRRVVPFDWRAIEGMSASRDWWILALEAIK
jgi:ubiquinone/menaquinone biosynthesis C-methylase UbiE